MKDIERNCQAVVSYIEMYFSSLHHNEQHCVELCRTELYCTSLNSRGVTEGVTARVLG